MEWLVCAELDGSETYIAALRSATCSVLMSPRGLCAKGSPVTARGTAMVDEQAEMHPAAQGATIAATYELPGDCRLR